MQDLLGCPRFSGRRAPEIPGADLITREGYSHEVSSVGWWPGDELVKDPAFYSYAAPQPSGFPKAPVRPAAASYNTDLSQFLLRYDDVRGAASPREALLELAAKDTAADSEVQFLLRLRDLISRMVEPDREVVLAFARKLATLTDRQH